MVIIILSISGRPSSNPTATLAVYQISPCQSHTFAYPDYPGPYSLSILEEKIAEFYANNASIQQTLSHLHLGNAQGRWKEEGRCQGGREDNRSRDQTLMSQRSGSSRPNPSTPEKPLMNGSAESSSRTLPPINSSSLAEATLTASHGSQSPPRMPTQILEPQKGLFPRPTGPAGMQNLLNPTAREENITTGQRGSAEQFDNPPRRSPATANIPPPVSQSRSNVTLPSITPPQGSAHPALPGTNGRRVLTPRTPSSTLKGPVPTTISLPGGMIDAKASPFMPSPGHIQPRESFAPSLAPNLPPLSVGLPSTDLSHTMPPSQSPSGFSASGAISQLPMKQERRPSGGAFSSQLPASQSNSPSTTYSSYSRFSNTPPALNATVATTQPSSFFHQPYSDPNPNSTGPRSKASYGSLSSSAAQHGYQLMTLDTEQGPIQVPIDVQAASKVADEKRKRNATASHRFRQRRKEKERETSNNIAKLEHQIREIAEEREFYRMERDYFRNVAYNKPGQAYVTRPPSPKQAKQVQATGNGQWQGQEEDNCNGRNTRRRTSSYAPVAGFHPPVNAGPPQLPGHYSLNHEGPNAMEQRAAPLAGNLVSASHLQHSSGEPAKYHRAWKA